MRNPCRNCIVKGNCSIQCKPYETYQTKMATTLIISTLIIMALIIVPLFIIYPSLALIFWGSSVIICHIIPAISNETTLFTAICFGMFLVPIFILAVITRPYIMTPKQYRKYKDRTFLERFMGINLNTRA